MGFLAAGAPTIAGEATVVASVVKFAVLIAGLGTATVFEAGAVPAILVPVVPVSPFDDSVVDSATGGSPPRQHCGYRSPQRL